MQEKPADEVTPPRLPTGARGKARRAMTASLAEEALELFERNGYDATSIDDICRHAQVSRTTFFRYFRTKEEALMGPLLDVDADIAHTFEAVPRDAPLWSAIRAALDVIVRAYAADSAMTLRVLRVFGATPSLGAFHQVKVDRWVGLLAPQVAARLGMKRLDEGDPRPAAVLRSAFACLDAALGAWAHGDGARTLDDLLDTAMDLITVHLESGRDSRVTSSNVPA